MTTTANDRRKEYAGNGVTTTFSGPRAFADSHIAVYLSDDTRGVAVQTDAFTLSNVGKRNRATSVEMDTAPPVGTTLLILRSVPFEQATSIVNQGAYLPSVVEDMADALAQQVQHLKDRADRALRFRDAAVIGGLSTVLPMPAALNALVWNADGNGFDNRPMADVGAGFLQASTGAVVRGVGDKLADIISLADFAPAADGIADDTLVIEAFIDALQAGKKTGHIPTGDYYITAVRRRELEHDLRIICGSGVRFIGSPTLQEFPGDGVTTLHTVTEYEAGANGFRVAVISALGVETVIDKNVHWTLDGQNVNLAGGTTPNGPVAIGDKLRVVSGNAMFELGPAAIDGCSVDWEGGYFDASARGYMTNEGSGSGFIFYNARRGSLRDAYLYASDDYKPAIAVGLGGDSGVTTLSCSNFKIESCVFEGWGDLGIYAGGSALVEESDDGYGVDIDNCGFIRCNGAAAVKRGGQSSHIHHCWARECRTGFSLYPAGNPPIGARGSVHDNFGIRMGRIFVDIRASRGVSVHDNTCIDIGYEADGVTTIGSVSTVQFLGSEDCIAHNNILILQDWAPNGQRGIVFGDDTAASGDATVNSTAHHNKVVGFSVGIVESGTGTGNAFLDNELIGCVTPTSGILAGSRCSYWDGSNRYERVAGSAQKLFGTYTPTLTNQTNVSASTASACQWSRVGNVVTVSGSVAITATANSATTELRLSLPVVAAFTVAGQAGGTATPGELTSAGTPAAVFAQAGGGNARLRYSSGAASAGASRDWYFSFTYLVP